MMRLFGKSCGCVWLGAFLWLLASPVFADQPMQSANYKIWRNGVSGGGRGAVSASYRSTAAVCEQPIAAVAGSTSSSSNYALGPGLMNVAFFPGRIMTFTVTASSKVHITSVTLQWGTTGYDGAVGALQPGTTYFIRLATFTVPDTFRLDFADFSFSTSAMNPGNSAIFRPVNLLPNATYYASIWTDDDSGNLSFVSNRSTFTTLAFPPGIAVPALDNVAASSMTAYWTDNGNSASVNLTTYTIVFTSNTVFPNTWVGNRVSSAAALLADLPPGSLDDNTTYYAWARSVNMVGTGTSSWVALGATSTLALPITHLTPYEFQYVFYDSATVRWARLGPGPSKGSSYGYLVMASTTNFGTLPCCPGGVILTSATQGVAVSSLTIDFAAAGLDSYTTWYFQAGSLNWYSAWNPVTMTRLNMQISQSTFAFTLGSIDPGVFQSTVSKSSMVVTNVGNIPATYHVWATTMAPCLYQLGTSRDIEQAVLQGQWTSLVDGPSSASFGAVGTNSIWLSTQTSGGPGGLYYGDQGGALVPPDESRTMWFQFWLPRSTVETNKRTIVVGVSPIYP